MDQFKLFKYGPVYTVYMWTILRSLYVDPFAVFIYGIIYTLYVDKIKIFMCVPF